MTKRTTILIFVFFTIIFILNAYDFLYLMEPIREDVGIGKEASFFVYVFYNFSFKLVYYLSMFGTLSLVIYYSAILWNLENEDTGTRGEFIAFVNMLVTAEIIFFLEKIYKIVYFTYLNSNYSFEDYTEFYPLSLYSSNSNYPWLASLAKQVNLFQVVFIGLLSVQIKEFFGVAMLTSLLFVLQAYVLPVLLWHSFLFYLGFG